MSLKENLPITRDNTAWSQIKNFFIKIFYKESKNDNLVKVENKKQSVEPTISFSQKEQEKSERYNYLLSLQNKFELDEIKENEINENDVNELRKIYVDQIEVLKRKISQKQRMLS